MRILTADGERRGGIEGERKRGRQKETREQVTKYRWISLYSMTDVTLALKCGFVRIKVDAVLMGPCYVVYLKGNRPTPLFILQ